MMGSDSMNEDKKQFLGIKKWHDAGIKGQGITVASIENGKTTHSKMVLDVLKQIIPEATILTSVKYWREDEIPPNLDGYTCSLEYSSKEIANKIEYQKALCSKNVFMTCSIGNDGSNKCSPFAQYNEWVSVGACRLNNNRIIPAVYSSESGYLDFCEITNWDTEFGNFNGSSCATPVLQGMAMLVKCYYKLKFNKVLTNAELFEFIRNNCMDIEEEGHDKKTGHGLFILPDMEEDMEIRLKIGSKIAYVDDKPIELDVPPKIENGRTLVPIRFVSENLGCEVEWDRLTESIYIRRKT
jgi:hypothetical protein